MAPFAVAFVALSCVAGSAFAQLRGLLQKEQHLPFNTALCSLSRGCCQEEGHVTLDANWRWVHPANETDGSCFEDGKWPVCKTATHCASHCEVEGVAVADYESKYGVFPIPNGVRLRFITHGPYGVNVGSRVYLLGPGAEHYKLFKLKNRELTFTVQLDSLSCGLNGALYLVEMPRDGGKSKLNHAGAKYGTGYCDAQCPDDIKYFKDGVNVDSNFGMCCPEMDLWEANALDTAFTVHPCSNGYTISDDDIERGVGSHYFDGICDKAGCDYNTYRLGKMFYYGRHRDVDTTKPITVTTQFLTIDGTDHGELVEIRRIYLQDGKFIANMPVHNVPDLRADSITDDFCRKKRTFYGETDSTDKAGGLKEMGKALDRGMVLVMSLWDDAGGQMVWLDGTVGNDDKKPGAKRGPCSPISSETLRKEHGDESVTFANIKVGHINSTLLEKEFRIPKRACTADDYAATPPAPPRTVIDVQGTDKRFSLDHRITHLSGDQWFCGLLLAASIAMLACTVAAITYTRAWLTIRRRSAFARVVEFAQVCGSEQPFCLTLTTTEQS